MLLCELTHAVRKPYSFCYGTLLMLLWELTYFAMGTYAAMVTYVAIWIYSCCQGIFTHIARGTYSCCQGNLLVLPREVPQQIAADTQTQWKVSSTSVGYVETHPQIHWSWFPTWQTVKITSSQMYSRFTIYAINSKILNVMVMSAWCHWYILYFTYTSMRYFSIFKSCYKRYAPGGFTLIQVTEQGLVIFSFVDKYKLDSRLPATRGGIPLLSIRIHVLVNIIIIAF